MKRLLYCLMILTLIRVFPCALSEASRSHSISRLDEEGYLYYMEYAIDYYGSEIMNALKEGGFIDAGCSSFFTHDPDGNPITCRNYDYPHRVSREDQSLTGLNVVLHCKPEGKYESIAMADAVWCGEQNPLLQKGGPDLSGFDIHLLDILPYQCMDGINEKGLCVSILRVDIKPGEQPARMPIASSMLVRYMLDDCANVAEAIQKVDTAVVTPEDWQDCHLFVTDANGRCVVIESRNSIVSVIESDIATNFYLGSDDMEDYYKNGSLREEAVRITDEYGNATYSFGYGHGYHRFVTIASQLERYQDTSSEGRRTVLPRAAALVILQSVAQNPYTNASGISMTQYSAIYDNAHRTMEVWPFQNYQKSWVFGIGEAHETSVLDEIRSRGVLKVGTAGDYQPMSYLDPETGTYVGFDAELAEDLAVALGVEIEYVKTSWPTLMEDTLAGKFDLAICGITVTDARKEQALMSDGYLGNGKTVLCRAEDADRYTSLEAINQPDVRVMENPGGLNEKFARANLPDAILIIHDVNQEIPGLVASGEADVMITEIMEAGFYVGQDSRLAAPLIFTPFTRGQLGVLMPKGSEDLLDFVNRFLKDEKDSGRIDELAEKYIYRYRFMYGRIPQVIRDREVLEIATGPGLLAKKVAPAASSLRRISSITRAAWAAASGRAS